MSALVETRDMLVGAAVVVAVFASSPLHLPLNNPNEGVRVFTTKALVEDHTFAIDHAVAAWGYIDDKSTKDGKLYSSKAPLVSLLAAAPYALIHPITGDLSRPTLTRLCRGFGDSLPSLLLAFLLWRGLRRLTKDEVVADLVAVGTVVGSGVLASMNVFSGHALAALGPAAALVLVVAARVRADANARAVTANARADDDARALDDARAAAAVKVERAAPLHSGKPLAPLRDYALAGLALATAAGAEYPAVLASIPVVVLAIATAPGRRLRAMAALVAGALPVVVVVSAAHTAMFGAPWRTGYSFLENKAYQGVVQGTLFGIGAPDLGVLARVLVSPDVGLFFYSPFLVAGAVATIAFIARPREAWMRSCCIAVAAGVVMMLAFIAGFRGWRGGWSVGPRYITEIIGLLALPTALAFDAWSSSSSRPSVAARNRIAARAVLAALVALGVLHSGVAGAFFPHLSDVFANPVYEMMLPVVGRGFAPDSFPLWLGMSPRAAGVVVVVTLFLPLGAACFAPRERAWSASLAASLAASWAALMIAVIAGPHLARDDAARSALEARRMLDNWRPEEGNPVLDGAPTDPHALIAVDRARVAWPIALETGCAPLVHEDEHGKLAELAVNDLGRFSPGTLVVVPDRYALDLVGLRSAANLFVVDADLAHEGKRGLPCSGNIQVLRGPKDALPPLLRGHREVSRHAAGPDARGDGALELIEIER